MSEDRHVTRPQIVTRGAAPELEYAPKGTTAELATLKRQRDALLEALNPRLWTKEMSDAWHKNIPDTVSAFDALRAIAAMKGEK